MTLNRRKCVEYAPNTKGRDFVVGDIHGMLKEFRDLLADVDFNYAADRCFSVGDLIDRGHSSAGCLELVLEPWFHPVYGNHEDLFVKSFEAEDLASHWLWQQNGGEWIEDISPAKIKYLYDLATQICGFITIQHSSGKKVGICHAQPPTEDWDDIKDLKDVEFQRAIWGRTIATGGAPKDYNIANVDLTVHGHCIIDAPVRYGNSLFIDTGSFLAQDKYKGYSGYITLLNLDDYLTGDNT